MSSLQDNFRAQARWRREKAEEYPDDERNAQSAAALESLAEYVNSCLLYTSPSPRDRTRSRMPSSA